MATEFLVFCFSPRFSSHTPLKLQQWNIHTFIRKNTKTKHYENSRHFSNYLTGNFTKYWSMAKLKQYSSKYGANNSISALKGSLFVCLFVGCLTSQQQASVSQGRICLDNFTCCHTEIQVADQTFYLTQPQYTDTGPTSPSADPITPDAWQGSHWSANF